MLPSWFITCCLMALLVVWSIFWILQKRTTSLQPSWTEKKNTNKGICHAVCYPLCPNIHIQILQTDLYTFPLRISWKNLIKDHGIYFINSHNLISWQCMDIVRRKLMLVTIGTKRVNLSFAPCKRIRIRESGKFLLVESGIRKIWFVESGILGFGIRNTAQGIRNPTNPAIWNQEYTASNPESKTVLDFLTWGEWMVC